MIKECTLNIDIVCACFYFVFQRKKAKVETVEGDNEQAGSDDDDGGGDDNAAESD